MAFTPFPSPLYSPYEKIKENDLCFCNGLTSLQMSAQEYPKDLPHITHTLKKQRAASLSKFEFSSLLYHIACVILRNYFFITVAVSTLPKLRSSSWFWGW